MTPNGCLLVELEMDQFPANHSGLIPCFFPLTPAALTSLHLLGCSPASCSLCSPGLRAGDSCFHGNHPLSPHAYNDSLMSPRTPTLLPAILANPPVDSLVLLWPPYLLYFLFGKIHLRVWVRLFNLRVWERCKQHETQNSLNMQEDVSFKVILLVI